MNGPDYGRSDIKALLGEKKIKNKSAENSGSANIFSLLELEMWP